MELVRPSVAYKDSFIQSLAEYQQEEHPADRLDIYALDSKAVRENFDKYIEELLSHAEGKNLPEGYVPDTQYWLVDSMKFIGRVSIRHSLTDGLLREGGHIGYDIRPSQRNKGYGTKILALVLPKAKELGLEKVLVTCDETNSASKKIIEANGGVLENSVSVEGKPNKLRYWITLK